MKKTEMEHGEYYAGHCRNAYVARWNAADDCFYHRRCKFGHTFIERIEHIEDADGFWDAFTPTAKCEPTDPPIPFEAANV